MEWDNISLKQWRRVWNKVNLDNYLKDTLQTSDCKSVWNTCDAARTHKLMIGIIGSSGFGKSTALKAYSIKANVFLRYVDGTTTPITFLMDLLQDMGIPFSGGYHDLLKRVIMEFNSLDEPLLLIDEVGKLNDRTILMLHSLRDQTMYSTGIILAGMPYFKTNLQKKVDKGVTGMGEFFRRIQQWQHLNGLSREEITYILEQNGITDKEEQQEFRKHTCFGNLDNAIRLHKTLNN